MAVAIFMECNTQSFLWDPLSAVPKVVMSLEVGQSSSWTIPLASDLESTFGPNVCGELVAIVNPMPDFCT